MDTLSQERKLSHELHFMCLYNPGRRIVIPCDEAGQVDTATLSERMRKTYQRAVAAVGREYLFPTIQLVH